MSAPPEVAAMVDVWPAALTKGTAGRGNCIECTRLATAVLGRLMVVCRPLPCSVWAGNPVAVGNVRRGVPMDQWPPLAYSVGVDVDSTMEPRSGPGGYDGHLVVAGPDWLLDLTANQLDRPDVGIHVPGAILIGDTGGLDPAEHLLEVELPEGTTVRYYPRPELARWRVTPAWRQDLPEEGLAVVVDRVRDRLEELADFCPDDPDGLHHVGCGCERAVW